MACSDHGLFTGVAIAEAYQKFRPTYPKGVVDRIINYLNSKNQGPHSLAVDVGCGSGQSTKSLSNHFDKVIGCDVSESQIQEAINSNILPNVDYKIGSGENIPAVDHTVDIVTSAQAAHWFNQDRFYKELDRVLKPRGCIALYGYGPPQVHNNTNGKQLQNVVDELYYKTLGGFWHDGIKQTDEHYKNVKLPYEESERDDTFSIEIDYSIAEFVGYLSSWSGYHNYLRVNPHKQHILVEVEEKLMSHIGEDTSPERTRIHVSFPVFLLLCRKP